MTEEWDRARYLRERRDFVADRLRLRPINFHAALIFVGTWGLGWLWSWALLKAGVRSMPLRYALSLVVAYIAFVAFVRVWSDFMRRREGGGNDWPGSLDLPVVDGEGCAIAALLLVVAALLTGVVAWIGGGALLLEVAFEVVFTGVVVRRLGRKEVVGAWAQQLVRRTALPALVIGLSLVVFAAWLQARAPQAATVSEALQIVWRATR